MKRDGRLSVFECRFGATDRRRVSRSPCPRQKNRTLSDELVRVSILTEGHRKRAISIEQHSTFFRDGARGADELLGKEGESDAHGSYGVETEWTGGGK